MPGHETEDAFQRLIFEPVDSSTDQTVPADPAIGTTILDRYRIEAVLGEGGMGKVYRAVHTAIGHTVAIKVIEWDRFPKLAIMQNNMRARFQTEAVAYGLIKHPNVVKVIDYVDSQGGAPVLVMEFVEGETLAALIKRQGPLADRDVREIGVQLLDGIAAIHAAGVKHRDIKPTNIMVRKDGARWQVTIVDLGLGKIVDENRSGHGALTEHGGFLGSVTYASPEQMIDASSVDIRTDIYSAGVVLYEMLAGRPPFEAPHKQSVINMHLNLPVPEIQTKIDRAWVPPDLVAVFLKAMAKDPAERYRYASLMRDKLVEARLTGAEYRQRRISAALVQPAARVRSAPAAAKGHGTLIAALLMLAVIGGASAGIYVLRRRGAAEKSAAVPTVAKTPAPETKPVDQVPGTVRVPGTSDTPATAEEGCRLTESGRHADAVAVLEMVVKAHPKDAAAWYCLGKSSSFVEGGGVVAARAYRSFLKLRPTDATKRRRAEIWLEHNAPK